MYTIMQYENLLGENVDFLADPSADGWISAESIQHTLSPRSSRRGKAEDHGSWPTFTYYESLLITIEGSIMASTSQKYNEFVTDIVQIMMPQPLAKQVDRVQGQFTIRKAGFGHNWEIPVAVDVPLQTPQGGLSPSRSDFHMSLIAFRPFYYEPATNRYYWPS